jgi:hypothetical protein
MTEQKMEHNVECKSPAHEKHLCHLMYEGFHYSHPQEYKEKVQNAQFRCQNCSRTANQEEDLCAPVAL